MAWRPCFYLFIYLLYFLVLYNFLGGPGAMDGVWQGDNVGEYLGRSLYVSFSMSRMRPFRVPYVAFNVCP